MFAFSTPRDLVVTSRYAHRRILAALPQDAAGGLNPARVILAIHDEDVLARRALEAISQDPAERLRLYAEAELESWPAWPKRVGRTATQGQRLAAGTPHRVLHTDTTPADVHKARRTSPSIQDAQA